MTLEVLERMIREKDEVQEEEEGDRNKIEEEVVEVDKGRGEATTIGLS